MNRAPAKGFGIHAYAHEVSRPIRLTDEELRAHQDEANLVRLAALTSTALDALAQLHLPDYRREVAEMADT